MRFYCKKCDNTVDVISTTMKVVNKEVVYPETVCNCGNQMKDITEFSGIGSIIKRPGGKVRGKI